MKERGILRPGWIAVSIITCVIFGSTVNRCLVCGGPAEAAPPPVTEVKGRSFLEVKGPPGEAEVLPPAPAEPKPLGLEDHEDLTFDKLASFKYDCRELTPGLTLNEQIPASVMELKGRKIAIKGFMLPFRNDGESVTEFILLRTQGWCCFNVAPRMNEWIYVTMAPGKAAPFAKDVPITTFGTLDVGEVYEKTALMSVYRMEGTAVVVPPVYR